jgi:hypothetical protein
LQEILPNKNEGLSIMNKLLTVTMLAVLALTSTAYAQTAVQISDILRDPFTYDRQSVGVSGTIKDLKIETEYESFQICDRRCLWVLAWGHAQLQEGQFLTVSGEFRIAKHIGPCTLKNILVVQKGTL